MVITGASSPLGEKTIKDLLQTGEYHVIGAYANPQEVQQHQNTHEHLTPMLCDLESLDSVRSFCDEVHTFRGTKTLDRLVCQAGITCPPPSDSPKFTKDGHEQIMQTNFLSHFLMTSMLLDSMVDSFDARVTMVGAPNSNDEIADLVNLDGFRAGFKDPVAMADGSSTFDAVKACQDSMLCQKMFTNFLHNKYYKLTGVAFTAVDLDDDANKASKGLMEMIHERSGTQSGASLVYKNDALVEAVEDNSKLNARVYDIDSAFELFKECSAVTGAEWPKLKQVTSPCPTLKVIGAVTKGKVKREELKRMRQGRPGISEPVVDLPKSKRQKIAAFADRVVSTVLSQTLGRVAGGASRRILGEVPEEAKTGSFDDDQTITEVDVEEIQAVIGEQLARDNKDKFAEKSKC